MVYIIPTLPPPRECAIFQIKSQLRSPTEKANASRAALTENGATPPPQAGEAWSTSWGSKLLGAV